MFDRVLTESLYHPENKLSATLVKSSSNQFFSIDVWVWLHGSFFFLCASLHSQQSNWLNMLREKLSQETKTENRLIEWRGKRKYKKKKADGERELAPKDTLLSFSLKYLPGYLQYVEANYLQYIVSNKLD